MSYLVQMSKVQMERIDKALTLLDKSDPVPSRPFDPGSWDNEDLEHLHGCVKSTLEQPEGKTLHGWNI